MVDLNSLKRLESQHRIHTLYLWLSLRFPETFVDVDQVNVEKKRFEDGINELLLSMKYVNKRMANMLKNNFEFVDVFETKPSFVEPVGPVHSESPSKLKEDPTIQGY
jgi:hypothetical protein